MMQPAQRPLRQVLAVWLAVGLLWLTACTAPAPGTTPRPPDAAPSLAAGAARPAWEAEWERTVAAAKQEGALAVIGTPQPPVRAATMRFQEAYPEIKVEYVGLDWAPLEPRVRPEREAGQFLWDVRVGGSGGVPYRLAGEGWFQPLKSALILPETLDDAQWLGGFDAGFADRTKRFSYGFTNDLAYFTRINRTEIPESELPRAADLVDPRWRGRITLADPRTQGAGRIPLAGLRKELGDEFIRRLVVDQQPVLTDNLRQMAEWVVRGRYPIGVGIGELAFAPFRAEGLGQDVKSPSAGVVPVITGNGVLYLMDGAPHPNAARVFANWLLTRETQAQWAQVTAANSRRLDVPAGNPELKPDPAQAANYLFLTSEEADAYSEETMHMVARLLP
jgi:iron(III) transport system substrate-binding protein